MKKIIFILVALLATTFSSYGQLQTKTIENARGYKTVYKFWMGYGEIRKFESGFVLFGASTNQFENSMHSIYLGDDKNSAIQSLKDLGELKKNCKDVVVVIGANQKETKIYKLAGETIFETNGVAGYTHALFYLKIDKAISAIQNY